MASLKEIKTRIASVKNTLKITSAMKLIASAKLHKAQMAIEGIMPYNERLTGIVNALLSSESCDNIASPLTIERENKRVALIAISSNASLCGGFNNNIIRLTEHVIKEYESELGKGHIIFFPIGRKMAQAFVAAGDEVQGPNKYQVQDSKDGNFSDEILNSPSSHSSLRPSLSLISDYIDIGDKPTYAEASSLASRLTDMFLRGEIDKVEILYTHYHNMAVQVLMREPFLPMTSEEKPFPERRDKNTPSLLSPLLGKLERDFIIEPSIPELLDRLLPQTLSMRMYAVLLDSSAAEHAARTFAMQQATDNGEGLLQELNLQYNKGRQQAITNELLDIMGGQVR